MVVFNGVGSILCPCDWVRTVQKSDLPRTKQSYSFCCLTLKPLQGFQLGYEIRNKHTSHHC